MRTRRERLNICKNICISNDWNSISVLAREVLYTTMSTWSAVHRLRHVGCFDESHCQGRDVWRKCAQKPVNYDVRNNPRWNISDWYFPVHWHTLRKSYFYFFSFFLIFANFGSAFSPTKARRVTMIYDLLVWWSALCTRAFSYLCFWFRSHLFGSQVPAWVIYTNLIDLIDSHARLTLHVFKRLTSTRMLMFFEYY